jgi:hypothetical protein
MTLLCVWRFTSIFGTVVEDKQMSTKDRLERKKYMGVCMWESEIVARMMSRFPSTVTRYMDRNSPNKRGCRSGSSENPSRRNSEILVLFPESMFWITTRKKNNVTAIHKNGHY